MKNELIRLRGVYAQENRSVLRSLDFKIFKGEAVGLVGGFYSGKPLLMDVIAGNCVPHKGYPFLYGELTEWDVLHEKLRVKYLKKNFGLIGPLTVWENIATYHRKQREAAGFLLPNRFIREARELLSIYGIEADPRTEVDRLTSVQKFVVALIKAKLENAELILVEGSELEYSVSGFRLMRNVLNLCREQGISVVISGIGAGGFMPLMDRVCLINEGHIVWEEPVTDQHREDPSPVLGVVKGQLSIPVVRPPISDKNQELRVEGEQFSVIGRKGEFLMVSDPEQELHDAFLDSNVCAEFLPTEEGQTVRSAYVRRVDFSCFSHMVKWMSPADNLVFGLTIGSNRFGVINPHMKKYVLNEFVRWTGDDKYLTMKNCSSLRADERIKLAAFRLKMDRPDVILFRYYHLLDQYSREIVLPVFAELLERGTLLIGITAQEKFVDFADGYYLMNGSCGRRLSYQQIQAALEDKEGE